MISTSERAMYSRSVFGRFLKELRKNNPNVFNPDQFTPVGIDICPKVISDAITHKSVEADKGWYFLHPGTYQFDFGYTFPNVLQNPHLDFRHYWRSSNHRCGCLGRVIASTPSTSENKDAAGLWGGNIVGSYKVVNPHGLYLEEDAAVAQLVVGKPGYHELVSDLLKPARVEIFNNAGRIGKNKTDKPDTISVPMVDDAWKLMPNIPYLVGFSGIIEIKLNEVVVPTLHQSDLMGHPQMFLVDTGSCMGDPGYIGSLGMLVVPKNIHLNLSPNIGIALVAKLAVLPFGVDVPYSGQWQGETYGGNPIEFKTLEERGLTHYHAPDLKHIVQTLHQISSE